MSDRPYLSIIIPVFNGGANFQRCLESIRQSSFTDWELIVVDDDSTDDSLALARRFGALTLQAVERYGPAKARNDGARAAKGQILFFVDADCAVHPDTLTRIAACFEADPELDALFGSYDDAPSAPNFVAQYKNLFHHYVHQNSQTDASTFWTGCGAIRRTTFLALNGFDPNRYDRPSIEDIDLGYRLKQAGGKIRLVKSIQVKHLKAWSFLGLLKSDIFDRGIPWSRLILAGRVFGSDLNLQTHNRISVVAIYGLLLAAVAGLIQPLGLLIALALALLLLWLNWPLYRFFYRRRGLGFVLRAIPLHWLYYFYNAISFGGGLLLHWREQLRAEPRYTPPVRLEPLGEGRPLTDELRDR